MLNNVFQRGRAESHHANNVPCGKAIGSVSEGNTSGDGILNHGVLNHSVLNEILANSVSDGTPSKVAPLAQVALGDQTSIANSVSQDSPNDDLAQDHSPQSHSPQSHSPQQFPPTPLLVAHNLSKSYGGEVIFDKVNFTIYANEFVCLIGHSGCGKTTILKALAGLESLTSGQIVMNGKPVIAPSLERGVVFQGHALLPWLTVADNIAFAIKARANKYGKSLDFDVLNEKVNYYLSLVGLLAVKHKKPAELSGGMKQRVGIARAFAITPTLLLMDEPFGALDALTRGNIQEELVAIVAKTAQTVFMITHDIDEAILLADRIFLMSNGPNAYLAEIVENTLQKPRHKDTIHHDHHYYPLRNYLLDFLIHRSHTLQADPHRPDKPKVVNLTWEAWSDI